MPDQLHPQVAVIAEMRRKLQTSRVLDPAYLRQQALAGAEAGNAGGPDVKTRREIGVPRPDGSEIRVVLCEPEDPRGLCVYYHGGGFVICCPETHDKLARTIAVDGGCTVASVDYRMGPEDPFPAAHNDAVIAAEWLMGNAEALTGDTRVVFAGDSAGGNLAFTAARWAVDDGRAPAGLLLLYPWLDLGRDLESRRKYGPDDFIIDDEVMDYWTNCYLPAGDVTNPLASPIYAPVKGLPHTVIVCGTIDPLWSDSETLVGRLREANVEHAWHPYEDMPHGFVSMNNFIDAARDALELVAHSVSDMLSKGQDNS